MTGTLGHYKILDRIGSGGLGEVYRARDTRLGRTVAVKVVKRDAFRDDAERRRLMEDARAAAALSHPHVAAFYEIGEDQGMLFLVSEFVPGSTLREVIGGRPINARRALEIASQVADGLAQAHAHGMAHGDIRADNIVVTPKGSVKVMEPAFTAWTGDAVQREAAREATGDDIYDLGVTLFEMLTGSAPRREQTERRAAIPAPSSVNRSLPQEIDGIAARMLAADPETRYSSAAVAAADLRQLLATLDERKLPSEPVPVPVPKSGSSKAAWLLLVLGLAAAAALVWLATNA
jgi:serine/threonine-protein kinase